MGSCVVSSALTITVGAGFGEERQKAAGVSSRSGHDGPFLLLDIRKRPHRHQGPTRLCRGSSTSDPGALWVVSARLLSGLAPPSPLRCFSRGSSQDQRVLGSYLAPACFLAKMSLL